MPLYGATFVMNGWRDNSDKTSQRQWWLGRIAGWLAVPATTATTVPRKYAMEAGILDVIKTISIAIKAMTLTPMRRL